MYPAVIRLVDYRLTDAAVVTLCPLVFDVLPFRCLTFDSDSDSINIGRSSKREAKNLTPADNNAWFESRVMSRNHASLRVSLEDKVRAQSTPLPSMLTCLGCLHS